MKITELKKLENDYSMGFAENGFVVYGMIAKEKVAGLFQNQIIQECYKQVRPAIAYENSRLAAYLPVSITYNEHANDFDFTPEVPQAVAVIISGPLSFVVQENGTGVAAYMARVFNQYGEEMGITVDWSASGGTISNGGTFEVTTVTEATEITITATTSGIDQSIAVTVVPYVPQPQPEPVPQPSEFDILGQMVVDLELRLLSLEANSSV